MTEHDMVGFDTIREQPKLDGMNQILDEFRKDVQAALDQHIYKAKSQDNPRYCLNYGDLSVTDVWYRVDYDGDVTLCADIEEGLDPAFDAWLADQVREKWEARTYFVAVRTEW